MEAPGVVGKKRVKQPNMCYIVSRWKLQELLERKGSNNTICVTMYQDGSSRSCWKERGQTTQCVLDMAASSAMPMERNSPGRQKKTTVFMFLNWFNLSLAIA